MIYDDYSAQNAVTNLQNSHLPELIKYLVDEIRRLNGEISMLQTMVADKRKAFELLEAVQKGLNEIQQVSN